MFDLEDYLFPFLVNLPMVIIGIVAWIWLQKSQRDDRAPRGQIKAVFMPKAGKGKPVSLGDFEDVTMVIRQMAKDYPDGGGVLLLYNEHGELYEAMRV